MESIGIHRTKFSRENTMIDGPVYPVVVAFNDNEEVDYDSTKAYINYILMDVQSPILTLQKEHKITVQISSYVNTLGDTKGHRLL